MGRADHTQQPGPDYWAPPQPREMPALRRELAEQMHSSQELNLTATVLAQGKGTLVPYAPTPEQSARILLDEEHTRLKEATLYWVSSEMTTEAIEAGASLPEFHLAAEDLPAEQGFITWQAPIGSYLANDAYSGDRTYIVAASWGHTQGFTEPGIWVTFWSPTDFPFMINELRRGGMRAEEAQRAVRSMRAELTWDNEVFAAFRDADQPIPLDQTNTGGADGADQTLLPWMQTLRATWLLMTQPGMAAVRTDQASRQSRRRAARDGYRSDDIHIVQLLQTPPATDTPSHTGTGHGHGHELQERHTVAPHWKQVAYGPNRSLRRPMWIKQYERGPEGAPLRTREDVHRLG